MASEGPPTFLDTIERILLRIVLGALALLVLLLAFAWWHNHRGGPGSPGAAAPSPAPTSTAITLVIDFGDGTQRRFTDLAFTPGMSALEAMQVAAKHSRPLAFEFRGQGPTAIITSIEGIKDESGDPSTSRAWQFWVNAAYGETSAGAAALHAGDRVSWAFRAYGKDRTPPP